MFNLLKYISIIKVHSLVIIIPMQLEYSIKATSLIRRLHFMFCPCKVEYST